MTFTTATTAASTTGANIAGCPATISAAGRLGLGWQAFERAENSLATPVLAKHMTEVVGAFKQMIGSLSWALLEVAPGAGGQQKSRSASPGAESACDLQFGKRLVAAQYVAPRLEPVSGQSQSDRQANQLRLSLLQQTVSQILARLGLPAATIKLFAAEERMDGAYRYGAGEIELSSAALAGAPEQLLNIITHELTHFEQDILRIHRAADRLGVALKASAEQKQAIASDLGFENVDLAFIDRVLAVRKGMVLTLEESQRADLLSGEMTNKFSEKFAKAFSETLLAYLPEKIQLLINSPAAHARLHLNEMLQACGQSVFASAYLSLPGIKALIAGQTKSADGWLTAGDSDDDFILKWDLIELLDTIYKSELNRDGERYDVYRSWKWEQEAWATGDAFAAALKVALA